VGTGKAKVISADVEHTAAIGHITQRFIRSYFEAKPSAAKVPSLFRPSSEELRVETQNFCDS